MTSAMALSSHCAIATQAAQVTNKGESCCQKAFARSRLTVQASNEHVAETTASDLARRELLAVTTLAAASLVLPSSPALALSKPPKGFSAHADQIDNYAFIYPFGWEEVAVKGQDITFKDVIEPLESVGVNIIKTDKNDLSELGPPDAVAKALVERVLSSPTQPVKLLKAAERDTDGRKYYTFEFLSQGGTYVRHGLATVAIGYGKFYTLITGANERRFSKVEPKLRVIVDSFQLL